MYLRFLIPVELLKDTMVSVAEFLFDKGILGEGAVVAVIDSGVAPVDGLLTTNKVVNGRPAGMVLVMDFESADAITELFESDDYTALVPIRDRGFEEMNILLTHTM